MSVHGARVRVYLAKAQWVSGEVVEDEIREGLELQKCKI